MDPDGRILDTLWDLGFTIYDVITAINKSSKGDHSGWLDVGIDLTAVLIPGVPAGLSKIDDALKAVRKADKIGDSLKVANKVSDGIKVTRPTQIHYFATNKNKKFTERMASIADKYGSNLKGKWNMESLPHQGRHPNKYHDFVLDSMQRADKEANGSTEKFLELFEKYVKEPIRSNPDLLRKSGWE